MYEFVIKEPFPYPLQQTYEATTTDFDSLLPYIPNLSKLQTFTREALEDQKVRYLIGFHGDSAIPTIARPIIKPSMLKWVEELICDPNQHVLQWEIITDHFTDHIQCRGQTYYDPTPQGTDIRIHGSLAINLEHVPGLPNFLVKKAVNVLEIFVGRLLRPNLREFYQAIKQRMADQYGPPPAI